MKKVQIVLRNALEKVIGMSVKAKVISGIVAATMVVGTTAGIVVYNNNIEEKKALEITKEDKENNIKKDISSEKEEVKDKDKEDTSAKEEVKEVTTEEVKENTTEEVTSTTDSNTKSNSGNSTTTTTGNKTSNSGGASSISTASNGGTSSNGGSNSNGATNNNGGTTSNGSVATQPTTPTYPKGFNSSATQWFDQDLKDFYVTQVFEGTFYNALLNYVNNGVPVKAGLVEEGCITTGEVKTQTTTYPYKEQYNRQDTLNLFYGSGVFAQLAKFSDPSLTNYMTVYNNGDGTVTLTLYHLCANFS